MAGLRKSVGPRWLQRDWRRPRHLQPAAATGEAAGMEVPYAQAPELPFRVVEVRAGVAGRAPAEAAVQAQW